MRLPFEGLICVLIAAGCSTNKTPETVDSTTVATSDTTEPQDASESEFASSEATSTANTDADATMADADATTAPAPAPATISDPPKETQATDTTKNEQNATPANTKPDNTKINKRDTNSAALTPMDQGENDADLKMTQQIRKAVMADGSLSFTAKNVKIITLKGKVTLRGPVKTAAELSSIEGAARKVAGPDMVDSQLELAP